MPTPTELLLEKQYKLKQSKIAAPGLKLKTGQLAPTLNLGSPETLGLTPRTPMYPSEIAQRGIEEAKKIAPAVEPPSVAPLDLIKRLYPERFTPEFFYQQGYGHNPSITEIPGIVFRSLHIENPEQFLQDLLSRKMPQETAGLLSILGLTAEETAAFLGATPEDISRMFAPTDNQLEILVKEVFPQYDLNEFVDYFETDFNGFIDDMRTGERTKEKQDLLRVMGYSEQDIQDIFSIRKLYLPVDGIDRLVTITIPDMRAFDSEGNWVGSWNPVAREFTALPEESKLKDVWDSFMLGGAQLYQQAKQSVVSAIPNFLFRDMTSIERKIYGDDFCDRADAANQEIRDRFRQAYAYQQDQFEKWELKHPELAPTAWTRESITLDNLVPMIGYQFASSAPFTLGAITATTLTTLATGGNIPLGLAAGFAFMTPPQAQDAYETLLSVGATEAQAGQMALPIAVVVSAIEEVGDLPWLKMAFPTIFKAFKKEATNEIAKSTIGSFIEKGIKTFAAIELTETLEEVAQQAVQNAANKMIDNKLSLTAGLTDTAIKTLMATAPLAIFGGGVGAVSLRRATASEIKGKTVTQLKTEGFVQKEGKWYEQIKGLAKEIAVGEVGAVELPGKPKKITPEVTGLPESFIKTTEDDILRMEKQITDQRLIVEKARKAFEQAVPSEARLTIPRTGSESLETLVDIDKVTPDMVKAVETLRDELRTFVDLKGATAGIKKFLAEAKAYKVPALPKAAPGMPEAIKVGDIITDGLVNAEVIKVGQFQFGKMKIEGYRARIVSAQGKGQETIINKTDAKLVAPEVPTAPPIVEELPLLTTPPETTLPMPDEVTVSEDRVVRPPPPPEVPLPPEPPPTHPPQPAPIEGGRLVMKNLQPSQQVVDLYSKPDFWRRVANLPLVKKAVGLFIPAAVANDPARQALILRAVLKDEAATKAQAVISHVWEIGTQDRIWGKTDEMGLLTTEPFVGISLDDIRTYPDKYRAQMTDKQREWVKRAGEIEKAKLEALKRNGIEINELSFEDGGQYAGRRVMGKFNDSGELIESGRVGVGGRVGAKQVFEKTRIFKDVDDGIRAGYRYMNSDEALYYNVLGAYYKIADKQMAEWILTKVDWRTTAAPETLVLQAESARLRLRKAQQLAAALNRAVRGERVPSNTISSIANVYPDQADTLKTLIPELQKPFPETANVVRILTNEAKALISEAKVEYYQAVDKRARAREEALRVKYEEASIAHPAFQGKIFTGAEAKEIADILRAGLQPQFIEALGAVNKVNAIGRFFMLAGDASPMAIQLQFLAFYRPVAYAKSWGGFVRAMFDPEFQYRQYANNRDLINRHPNLLLSGRGTEFTEFMGRGGLGKKLGVLAKPLVPFQKAFEGCLDTAGIELAKSLDHLCTTPERTAEVDQFINEFRGVTSSARIGVSSTQRQVETALILAPRYNRAIAGYLFDVVHGGLRGHQARMSLARGFAGLAAMAVAVSIALGEEDDEIWEHFNPESSKFFTWDVMGVKVGIGGKVRSVIKLFGNMTRTGEIGQPFLNFLRGNLSPGASTGLDLITGKNYIGEPTRDNVIDFTRTVGRNFMMIWTQGFLMEGGTLKDKAIIATAEFLGLRGYDISARKELKIRDLVDLLGQQIGKTPLLTIKKPDIYQTNNIYSDIKRLLQYTPLEEISADKGYAPWGHLVIKIEQSEANTLPDIALKNYNFDPAKGDTSDDYIKQWVERSRIFEAGEKATYTRVEIVEGKEERTEFKGLAALVAHKADYPNAQLGNLTRRQKALLLEYNAAVNKKQFAIDNPDININPKTEWLKGHPKENAELAIFGQAKILTREAYNQFLGLVKSLDIPDSALPALTLPPESSLDTHFAYEDMVAEGKHGSWEAQLLLKKDARKAKDAGVKSYTEWRTDEGSELKLSDTPMASLELKTIPKYHEIDNKLNKEDDPDYIGNLDDKIKDKDGLTARDRARAELMDTKIPGTDSTYRDMERKVKVIEEGTDEKPIDTKIVDAHVEFGRIQDKEGVGSSSAESMLFRVDHPEYDKFRTDIPKGEELHLEPIDESKIPKWRINVKYAKQDAEYQAILDKYGNKESKAQTAATDAYLALPENEAYRLDRRRREAYGLKFSVSGEMFPRDQVENYVTYNELPTSGKRRARFVVENPNFAAAMFLVTGGDIFKTKPEDVPAVQFDDIYDQYKSDYDLIDDFTDINSPNYKDNTTEDPKTGLTEREQATYDLVFDKNGKYTDFGLADIRRDAYGALIPETYTNPKAKGNPIDDYVGYYTIYGEGKGKDYEKQNMTELWYEDDWFLIEHKDFYKDVYLNPKYWTKSHERRDFSKVPDRDVFDKYLEYVRLITPLAKKNYRLENLDLDVWGVIAFGWRPIEEQTVKEQTTEAQDIEQRLIDLLKGERKGVIAPIWRGE